MRESKRPLTGDHLLQHPKAPIVGIILVVLGLFAATFLASYLGYPHKKIRHSLDEIRVGP